MFELLERVHGHCMSGVREGKSEQFPIVGAGNALLVGKIVVEVTREWLSEESLPRLRQKHTTLADVVAMVVYNQTRNGFSWGAVNRVIEKAGKAGVYVGLLDSFREAHPRESAQVAAINPRVQNVKRSVQDLARTILWVEALTFLQEEGYEELLKA